MKPDEASAAFSSNRLRLARFLSGVTMKELAERTQVTGAAISQFESGSARPSPATLSRLALATGVPMSFFAHGRRELSIGEMDGTHFRSLRSAPKKERAKAWAWSELALDLAAACELYVELPEPDVPQLPVEPDAPREELEERARAVRQQWGMPEGPAGSVVGHMEAHGTVVTRFDVDASGIDAFSHYQSGRPVVVLNSGKGDAARGRFDAAHELGHLVCHPDADPGGAQEQQAHAFAAELLMPRSTMVEVLPRRFDLGAYGKLKQTWGVSIAALLYRARTLGVLSDSAYRRSVMVMRKRYGRSEPYPVADADIPRLLAAACALIETGGVPLERLAADAGLTSGQVVQLSMLAEQKPKVVI